MPDEKMAFPYQQSSGGELPDFMELIGAPESEINQNTTEDINNKVVLERRPPDPPEPPPQAEKKLTMAEIQRMKINAASEAYRKLREGSNNEPQKATTEIGPPPPLIPTNSQQPFQQPPMPMQQSQPRMTQFQLGPQHAALPKPNIDLGAVVRSTIINGVTKTFSQVDRSIS